MKTLKEECQEIRNKLKEIGITSRQVSVKGSYALYDSVIRAEIKDLSVNVNLVKEITENYRSVDYCIASGEVLEGGNTYVRVNYNWESIRDARLLKEEEAKKIFDDVQGKESYTIADRGKEVIQYYNDGSLPVIQVLERPEGYENMSCYCYDTKYRYVAHNVPHIAEALVFIENKMY
jgi:hypothetical protein